MSDYDHGERSTDLDSNGPTPAAEPDLCAQPGGHGMEKVSCRTWLLSGSRPGLAGQAAGVLAAATIRVAPFIAKE